MTGKLVNSFKLAYLSRKSFPMRSEIGWERPVEGMAAGGIVLWLSLASRVTVFVCILNVNQTSTQEQEPRSSPSPPQLHLIIRYLGEVPASTYNHGHHVHPTFCVIPSILFVWKCVPSRP